MASFQGRRRKKGDWMWSSWAYERIEPSSSVGVFIARHDAGSNWRRWEKELSKVEATRCEQFLDCVHADRYAFSKVVLRRVLETCGHPLNRQNLLYLAGGKPLIPNGDDLAFSLSHSGDAVMVAVQRHADIGADIEQIVEILSRNALLDSVFGYEERLAIAELERASQVDPFFTFWTRKEAALKATGVGLLLGCTCVNVSRSTVTAPATDGSKVLLTLVDLPAPVGFAMAIATNVSPARVHGFLPRQAILPRSSAKTPVFSAAQCDWKRTFVLRHSSPNGWRVCPSQSVRTPTVRMWNF